MYAPKEPPAAGLAARVAIALIVCPALLALLAHAQSLPAQTQPGGSAWLRVTADGVNLRSRPDRNSLPVVRLPTSSVLRATGREGEWWQVEPPPGAFCYVSAEYIDVIGPERGVVSVRSGNLRVRVGSSIVDVDPSKTEAIALLPRGAEVKILGRQDGWLRVEPPPNVRFYVHADYVEQISQEQAELLRVLASQPAQELALTSRPSRTIDLTGPWGRRLAAVEQQMAAEAERPVLEQSWERLIDDLMPIASQHEEPLVARLAAAWIAELEQRIVDQQVLRAAQKVTGQEQRSRQQFEREQEQLRRAREQAASQPGYVAKGQLLPSLVGAGPAYKLEDPLTRRTVAYLEIAGRLEADVRELVGRYVGVRGQRRFEATLGVDVVEVSEIVDLMPRPAAPGRGQP